MRVMETEKKMPFITQITHLTNEFFSQIMSIAICYMLMQMTSIAKYSCYIHPYPQFLNIWICVSLYF